MSEAERLQRRVSGTRRRLSPRAAAQQRLYEEAMASGKGPAVASELATGEPASDNPAAVEARKLARRTDVETSRTSAAANPSGKESHRRRILRAHADRAIDHKCGCSSAGLIDDEAAAILGIVSTETTRRCSDLRTLGLLAWLYAPRSADEPDEFDPVTRKTRSARSARVSVITTAGWDALDA